MLFNSIKEINRLIKEINRLLSKGMSNIYLKVTIETFSKFQFSVGFWGDLTYTDIIEFKKILFQSEVWEQNCVLLFYYFSFEKNYDVKVSLKKQNGIENGKSQSDF